MAQVTTTEKTTREDGLAGRLSTTYPPLTVYTQK